MRAYDPVDMSEARCLFVERPQFMRYASATQMFQGPDTRAIVTEWPEFYSPEFAQVRSLLNAPVIFDGGNLYASAQMHVLAWRYFAIGRGAASQPAVQTGASAGARRDSQGAVVAG